MKILLENIKEIVGIAVVALALFFIISGLAKDVTPSTAQEQTTETATTTPQKALRSFQNLNLEARAAFVYDLRAEKEIFSRNAQTPLPIASLTKLMTALIALENTPNTNTVVTIGPDALLQDGESGFWLYEQWNLDTLLDITLVGSSNDGAYAVAASIAPFLSTSSEDTFVQEMNKRASELGLVDTIFRTPTGLDIHDETESSAYGSARDMTRLFAYILKEHPELLEVTRSETITRTSLLNRQYHIQNTNPLVADIPFLIGSKTGFTDVAGGNLIIAFDAGLAHPIIITVLGSTKEGRFSDMETLIKATLEYVTNNA